MDATEIEPYVSHRLQCVGWQGHPAFDQAAMHTPLHITETGRDRLDHAWPTVITINHPDALGLGDADIQTLIHLLTTIRKGVRSLMTGGVVTDFPVPAYATTPLEYATYRTNSIEFVQARNDRIRRLDL